MALPIALKQTNNAGPCPALPDPFTEGTFLPFLLGGAERGGGADSTQLEFPRLMEGGYGDSNKRTSEENATKTDSPSRRQQTNESTGAIDGLGSQSLLTSSSTPITSSSETRATESAEATVPPSASASSRVSSSSVVSESPRGVSVGADEWEPSEGGWCLVRGHRCFETCGIPEWEHSIPLKILDVHDNSVSVTYLGNSKKVPRKYAHRASDSAIAFHLSNQRSKRSRGGELYNSGAPSGFDNRERYGEGDQQCQRQQFSQSQSCAPAEGRRKQAARGTAPP